MDRGLLPPKKMLGKNSKSLVERRQKELELYLQTLLLQFPHSSPTALASFLHFHLYVSSLETPPTCSVLKCCSRSTDSSRKHTVVSSKVDNELKGV